jgi:hypothetical protein
MFSPACDTICPVCRGQVRFRATTCACGFDLATGELAIAMERASRDLWNAWKLQLVGLGAFGPLLAFCLVPMLLESRLGLPGFLTLLLATTYGLGHGTSLHHDARRRLRVMNRMRQLPLARVVQRDRKRSV